MNRNNITFITCKCPSCGGILEIKENNEEIVKCKFCNSQINIINKKQKLFSRLLVQFEKNQNLKRKEKELKLKQKEDKLLEREKYLNLFKKICIITLIICIIIAFLDILGIINLNYDSLNQITYLQY